MKMSLFPEEEMPLFDVQTARSVNRTFQQKPVRIPLELPLQPTYMIQQEPNVLPIVAIVGVLAFFGFLAFLAFFKSARPQPTVEKLEGEISQIRKELKYGR
jgi:hypothetical protein